MIGSDILRDERGVAAVEFAFVLPLLIMLLAGAIEFRQLWQASRAVNTLAAQTALVMADCNSPSAGTCAAAPARITDAVGWLAPNLDRSRLNIDVIEFVRAGGTSKLLSGPATVAKDIGLDGLSTFRDGQTGVAVQVRYVHVPTLFSTILKSPEMLTFKVTAYALRS